MLRSYKLNAVQDGLEPIDYLTIVGAKIISGAPKCSLRMDIGGIGEPGAVGAFAVTVGVFELTYAVSEMATILEGEVEVTEKGGDPVVLKPGDSLFLAKGDTATWNVKKDLVKSFYITPNETGG